jgi:hypothetical protein
MTDNDMIRRSDAIRQADRWVRGFVEADTIGKAITALPAADPLADPRVKALVEAARQTMVASELREAYHRLPNDKNRIGDPKSRKSKTRDAWLKAFRRASSATAAAIAAFKGDEA